MMSISEIYLKLAHFPFKIGLIGGVGGVPKIFFALESYYLCYLGAHAKFENPTITLSWRLSRRREERERKIMPSLMATSLAGARTPLGPIVIKKLVFPYIDELLVLGMLVC